jgi:hypothetical protein
MVGDEVGDTILDNGIVKVLVSFAYRVKFATARTCQTPKYTPPRYGGTTR